MINEKVKSFKFGEFKQWLHGLIEGKRGNLPDIEDWKRIKSMMDRVEPDIETVTLPSIPYSLPHDSNPWPISVPNPYRPTIDPIQFPEIWCGGPSSNTNTNTKYTLTESASDMDTINKLKTMRSD